MGSVILPAQLILFWVVFEILFEVLVFGAISLWREQIGFPSSSWAALRLCLAHTTIDEALTFFPSAWGPKRLLCGIQTVKF